MLFAGFGGWLLVRWLLCWGGWGVYALFVVGLACCDLAAAVVTLVGCYCYGWLWFACLRCSLLVLFGWICFVCVLLVCVAFGGWFASSGDVYVVCGLIWVCVG